MFGKKKGLLFAVTTVGMVVVLGWRNEHHGGGPRFCRAVKARDSSLHDHPGTQHPGGSSSGCCCEAGCYHYRCETGDQGGWVTPNYGARLFSLGERWRAMRPSKHT